MLNFLGTIYREAPDAAAGAATTPPAAPPPVIDPANPPAAEGTTTPAPSATEADPAATDPPAAATGKKPWYLDRISGESARAREAEAKAAEAIRRAEAAEAMATRLQQGKETATEIRPAADAAPVATPAVIREAAEKLRFYEDTVEVKNRGIAKYGAAFTDTLTLLNAVGATTDDFVADVLAVNKAEAHDIFKQIADNPEKAVSLASMNSRQRIAELTRMAIAAPKTEPTAGGQPTKAAPAPAARVSKAPEPAPKIEPSSTESIDGYSDKASDAAFTEKFNARMKERSLRR